MCGILSVVSTNLDNKKSNIDNILDTLSSRGPDGRGLISFNKCTLGHQRLSIIDLDSGNQPMISGDFSISFNGEIYNYKEIKKELIDFGFIFNTESDTEVILKAFEKWGEHCVPKLDGMFAFVIWDNKKEELFFARDRLGQKPLFYYQNGNDFYMCSEIKAILNIENIKPKLDFKSLDNYLRIMYIPPWKTVYKNIKQVPPAHYGFFRNNSVNLKRYWKLKYRPLDISYEEAKNKVHDLLVRAIKKRLVSSDVEVGTFLSGGVDSSLVSIIASKLSGNCIKTFCVSYPDHDELPFAKEVAEKIKSQVESIEINPEDLEDLEDIIKYFDEPHADTSDFPQHLISKKASEKVKVIISGDGADELFLGYKWHLKKQESFFDNRIKNICSFNKELRSKLWGGTNNLSDDIFAEDVYEGLDDIRKMMVFDMTSHLPGQILTKIDRTGMMHGLEVRSPFLDTELIEYVFNLPYEYKINERGQKIILRDILSEYTNKDFAFRKKQGFGSPIWNWLNKDGIKRYVYTKLNETTLLNNFLNKEEIGKVLKDFYEVEDKHERSAQRLWVLLCLEIWLENNKKYL